MRGGGGCGVSASEYSCSHGAQIIFGDLAPYLTFGLYGTTIYITRQWYEIEVQFFHTISSFISFVESETLVVLLQEITIVELCIDSLIDMYEYI